MSSDFDIASIEGFPFSPPVHYHGWALTAISAIQHSSSLQTTKNLKHVNIREALVRDLVERNLLKLELTKGKVNVANLLTKVLGGLQLKSDCDLIGLQTL